MGEKILFQESAKKDRRRFARVATNLYITYSFSGMEVMDAGIFVSKNVSGGGFLFESLREISVGTVMDLFIHLPTSPFPLPAKGKVVRVEKTKPYGRFDIGLSLIEILDRDRRVLIKYLVSTLLTKSDYESLFGEEEYWKNIFGETELKETKAVF